MTATAPKSSTPAQAETVTPTTTPARRAPAKRSTPAPAKRATPAPAKRRSAPVKKAAPAKAPAAVAPVPAKAPVSRRAAAKAPAASQAVTIDDGKKAKPQKVVRDTFNMPQNEYDALKLLRKELKKSGRRTCKSEVLRAGLRLLLEQDPAALLARINALPPAAKQKRKKG